MKKFDTQYYAIENHGKNLQVIFPATKDYDPIELCKKLRRIETKVERHNERICSDESYCQEMTEEKCDKFDESILLKLEKILKFKSAGVPVFINGDPRGYALKIESEYVAKNNVIIHRDWGGYGIIAPNIGKKGEF